MAKVRVGSNNEVVIPEGVLEALNIRPGDYVEISVVKYDAESKARSGLDSVPYTDEPLSGEDKAGLEAALEDIKAGRVRGPFTTAEEVQAYLDSLKSNG